MENFVYGRNNVLELLTIGERSISKIILLKTSQSNPKINKIIDLAKERGIIYQFLPKEKFQKYSDIPHQGIIAFVPPIEYVDLETFLASEEIKTKYKRVIITDGVEDPHNMGSIIRTAVCAGFDAVIFPSRRNALINATVEKSSAGATNHIDLIMVNSLVATVDRLKNNDFWIIATDINANDNYFDIDYCNMNFAIIVGSEKEGIASTLLKKADYKVKIPILNDFDSLNVANAASIVIYESTKQFIQKSKNVV